MSTTVWYAGTRVIIHVAARDSGGRVSVWESEEPRGTALPLHIHTREDEQMVVLAGEVSVRLGEATHRLRGGDTLALPLFLEHGSTAETPPPPPPREVMRAAVERLGVRVVGPPAR